MVLVTSESAGFFHWMTDALPRLEILRKAGAIPWHSIDHFLIGEGCHAIRESLRLLGVEESKFVVTRRDSHFVCDSLVVPSFHGAPGNIPPWAIEFLREQFLGVVSAAKVEAAHLCHAVKGFGTKDCERGGDPSDSCRPGLRVQRARGNEPGRSD